MFQTFTNVKVLYRTAISYEIHGKYVSRIRNEIEFEYYVQANGRKGSDLELG